MDFLKESRAFILLFITFFCWGSVYVGGRMISGDVDPTVVAGLRCLVSVFPLLFLARKHLKIKIDRSDWKYFLGVGIFGYYVTFVSIQLGISLCGASMASLVNSLTPVAITVVAAVFLKEKITPVKILCLVLALAGTYVITSGVESSGAMLGIAVVLFSLISWSFASVFMRRLTAKYPAILVTALGMAVALCFHIPTMLVNVFALDAQVHFTPKVILVLLYLGLVGSGLAQATWTASLSYLPASTCSLFYPLQPMFSAILGAAILGETFAPTFFIGMFLISLDVILSTLETRRLSRLEAEQEVKK